MKKIESLTDVDKETLHCIRMYFDRHKCSPGYRDLMRLRGVKSLAPIQSSLVSLEAKGFITTCPGQARSIRLTPMKPIGKPTDTEQWVLMVIHGWLAQNEAAPTSDQLMEATGIASAKLVVNLLNRLQDKLWLHWDGFDTRSIKIWFQCQ